MPALPAIRSEASPVGSPGSARRECRWDDRCVITADDVETLLFDVLGTVVDEAGSMRAELAATLDQAAAGAAG